MASMVLAWILIIGSPLVGIISVLFIVTWIRAHKVVIRDPTHKNQLIKEHLVKEKVDKHTKNRRWKSVFWQRKFECERPPSEAINVRTRGRMFAECYKLSEDEFVWIQDTGIELEKNEDGSFTITGETSVEGKKTIDTFKPYSETQRIVVHNQFKKAELINKNRWTPDKIVMLSSIGILGLIIVVGIIFGADILKAKQQSDQIVRGNLQLQDEMLNKIAAISAALGTDVEGYTIQVVQKPQQKPSNVITTPEEEPPDE